MSLTTTDHTPQPVPRKFPRLMRDHTTGAVFLVSQRMTRTEGPTMPYVYDVTCVHHVAVLPAMPTGAVPQYNPTPPLPPRRRPAIGEQIPEVTNLDDLTDYGNVVSMQNDG